jgi:hypothetical protein
VRLRPTLRDVVPSLMLMPVIRVRNASSEVELSIDQDRMLLASGEKQVAATFIEIEFIVLVVTTAPRVVTYNQINSLLLEPRQIAQPPTDPLTYIRKLKLAVDRKITDITGFDGAIEAVRGVGYRLTTRWEVTAVPSVVDPLLSSLADVLSQSVQLMERTPLREDEDGRLSLVVESLDADITPLLVRLDGIAQQIVMQVGANNQVASVTVRLLNEIRTYVAFARVGQVDEGAWRRLFVSELQTHLNHLGELLYRS